MGRPREHDEGTALGLLEAAERTVHEAGLEKLSVRGLADDVGTSTRAVYSLFGSKDGLIVALGTRAFEMLGAAINELPTTDDPAADLVEAGVVVFRRFVIAHPSLFRIGVQGTLVSPALRSGFRAAANEAFDGLEARVRRVEDVGLLGGRSVRNAATQFHALCEGLAAVELRGMMSPGQEERFWYEALAALVGGFAVPTAVHRRRARRRRPSG